MLAPSPAAPAPACTAPAETNAPVTYVCDDGSTLVVRFELESAHPRGEGDEATWTLGRRAPVACQVRK